MQILFILFLKNCISGFTGRTIHTHIHTHVYVYIHIYVYDVKDIYMYSYIRYIKYLEGNLQPEVTGGPHCRALSGPHWEAELLWKPRDRCSRTMPFGWCHPHPGEFSLIRKSITRYIRSCAKLTR